MAFRTKKDRANQGSKQREQRKVNKSTGLKLRFNFKLHDQHKKVFENHILRVKITTKLEVYYGRIITLFIEVIRRVYHMHLQRH